MTVLQEIARLEDRAEELEAQLLNKGIGEDDRQALAEQLEGLRRSQAMLLLEVPTPTKEKDR